MYLSGAYHNWDTSLLEAACAMLIQIINNNVKMHVLKVSTWHTYNTYALKLRTYVAHALGKRVNFHQGSVELHPKFPRLGQRFCLLPVARIGLKLNNKWQCDDWLLAV